MIAPGPDKEETGVSMVIDEPTDVDIGLIGAKLADKGKWFNGIAGGDQRRVEWRFSLDLPNAALTREARSADLVLLGQKMKPGDAYNALDPGSAILKLGRPTLVVPEGVSMRQASPETAMLLADPEGSVLAPYIATGRMIEAGSWAVEGIGEDFVPPNADLSLVSKAFTIPDAESFATARELLRMEGVLAGSSSGTLLAAALRYCRAQSAPQRVVSLVCDSGAKYLSKVFNPTFLAQEGWSHPHRHGTVRDVVVSRYSEGTAVFVRPRDNLRTVFARMFGIESPGLTSALSLADEVVSYLSS